ncbi:MAG TPA: serine/threonine-protein kinase, partial [Patescibacteria group bacterium]|nr:serine/threonine-protein kinase [Patescibacteria group bacterium]
MSYNNDKLESLFHQALKFAPPERHAFLVGACGDNDELRRRLEELLTAEADAGGFLPDAPQEKSTVQFQPQLSEEERIGSHIDRYKLLEKIGEGGFGEVWLAEQKEPVRRKVALKVIKLGMDTKQVIARFEAERQALALMDHPNIAKVLDAGTTGTGRPYFIMELVRGIPITRFCDENKLSIRERLDLFIKVCHAVQHAHQKGIIHRDLKPSNVLVTLHDGVPVPKVIDFGIAKATQQELTDKTIHTMFQQFIGTPAYVSPEQAEMSGLDVDTRSDIYSLGVLLYELLTGTTPFDTKELVQSGLDEMRKIIRERAPVRPSTRLTQHQTRAKTQVANRKSQIPSDLDWIVMKCLEKDRTRRYETASGLASDVKRHLGNEPITARPPSKVYEFQRTVQRHKFGFAAAAAIIVVLAAGAAVSTWQAVRARRAENKALQAQRNEMNQRHAADASRDNERQARERADDNARQLEQSLYLKRMSLAHWNLTHEPPNIAESEELLDSCKPEFRGWEWNYLKRQWLVEPYVLRDPRHHGVNSIAFSPDDRYLASAGADGKVTVWDIATRRVLRSFIAHTNGYAFSVAFDPTDSAHLVSAGSDKHVKLWDWNATNVLHSWPIQFSFQWGMAHAVAFNPNGKQIAAAVGRGIVTVWNATTGKELFSVSGERKDSDFATFTVFSLAFSPDGQRLAAGSSDGLVSVFDARTGQLIKNLGRPTNPVSGLAFSDGEGRRLTAASFDSSVRVWDVDSGKMLLRWRAHSARGIYALALSPDQRRLATGGFDRTIKLWDENSGLEALTFSDFTKEVQSVSFSHNGHFLAACSVDGTIRVWDATPRTGDVAECLLTIPHLVRIATMNVRKDGLWIVGGGERLPDEQGGIAPVFISDSRSGQLVKTLQRKSLFLFSAEFSPDGRFLAATGDDRDYRLGYTLQIWDMGSGRPTFRTDPFPGEGCVFCQAYSPDGQRLLGGSQDGRILVWDGVSGSKIGVLGNQNGAVFHLVFSP